MTEKKNRSYEKYRKWIPDEARNHLRSARKEMRHSFDALFPPEFNKHRRKARREILLAWRSMIDHALEKIDQSE